MLSNALVVVVVVAAAEEVSGAVGRRRGDSWLPAVVVEGNARASTGIPREVAVLRWNWLASGVSARSCAVSKSSKASAKKGDDKD